MSLKRKVWFKRKTYGWGWTPSSWEGWSVLLLYIVYLVYIFSKFRNIDSTSHSGSDTIMGFTVPVILLTVLLLLICYIKGESPK